MGSPETLRLALLGCGAIARYHLDGIASDAPRVRVTAAIDRDPEAAGRVAAETGAAVFGSLEEALAGGDFDAVDILLPHDLHEWATLECLRAGKHVLCEKPMAPTLDACERMLRAGRESGRVFMVAENAQYWPEIVLAAETIRSGAIGELVSARAAFTFPFDAEWFGGQRPWRLDRARTGGGITIDGGSHWIRPLRMWLGEIEEVVAALDHPLRVMEGESLVRSILRFRSGKVATFDALMLDTTMAPEPWWRVTGTRGELLIDGGFEGGLHLYDPQHPQGRLLAPPRGYAASFGPELADFARAVLDGTPPAAGPEESLGELRTALAIYRSAASKRWEKIWE
ncbi:MAG TPA: Gfo/Idh/MocA family oxidoreductase [Chloroflexota bacterium]|nr:Gfo/Idh/MocA family oxidoreductase [Chloroflexota bacterium]